MFLSISDSTHILHSSPPPYPSVHCLGLLAFMHSTEILVVHNAGINVTADGIYRKRKLLNRFVLKPLVLVVCTFYCFTYFQNVGLNWKLFFIILVLIWACGYLVRCVLDLNISGICSVGYFVVLW